MSEKPESRRGVERPAAQHEDDLSPAKVLRETVAQGGQRIGDNTPVANPEVSFPDPDA